MHRIITDDPEYQALVDRQRNLDAARNATRARITQAQREHAEATADHQEAVRTALLAGEAPPDPPVAPAWVDPVAAEQTFIDEGTRLRYETEGWFEDNADRLIAELVAREAELYGKARQILSGLAPIQQELAEIVASVGRAVAATGERPETPTVTIPTVAVAAWEHEPLTGRTPKRLHPNEVEVARHEGGPVGEAIIEGRDPEARPRYNDQRLTGRR